MLLRKIRSLLEGNKLAKNVAIYGVSNGISALAPFILLPVLTSYLAPSEFGIFSIFMLLVGVFSILTGVNIHGSIGVNYFKLEKAEFASYVSSCFSITVINLALTFIVYKFLYTEITSFLSIDNELVLLAIIVGFINVFYLSCLAIMQASDSAFSFLKLKFTQSISEILLTLLFVAGMVYGLNGRVASYGLTIFICFSLSVIFLLKKDYIGKSINAGHIRKALLFGVPLLPHALSGSVIMFIDRIVITDLIDTAATGIYMAGLQVAMVMMLIIEPVNKAYAPWLFKELAARPVVLKNDIVKNSYIYFMFLIVLALLLYAINDFIFYLLVDEKYYKAKEVMFFLYLGFAFQGMYYTVTNYVFFAEKTGVLSMVTMITAVLGTLLSYTLVSVYGIVGASLSFMVTNLILFLSVWGLSNKYQRMPWFSFKSGRA